MLKIKKGKHNFVFIVFMFLFIYYPPILNINMLHIIAILSYVYLVFHYKIIASNKILNILSGNICKIMIVCVYSIIIAIINTGFLSDTIGFLQLFLEVIPSSIAAALYMKKKKYTLYDSMNLLIILGIIQGVIAILAFAFPSLQQFLVQRAIHYGFNASKYNSFLDRRYYGLAYNLVTYVPVLQSFLAVISLKLAIDRNKKYFIALPILIFSAIINGRSSTIIILIGLVLLILEQIIKRQSYKFIKLIAVFSIGVYVIYYFIGKLELVSYRAYTWISEGLWEIFFFITERNMEGSFFSTLNSWKLYIPSGMKFIFGIGELSIGGNSSYIATDIGYINYLWLGGIILLVLLHIYYFDMIIQMYQIGRNRKNSLIIFYSIFFIITCVIFNIKMPVFLLNEFSIVLILSFITLKVL